MPMLSDSGTTIICLFVGCWTQALGWLPLAQRLNALAIGCVGLGFFPLLIGIPLASVGSSCDELQNHLNELRLLQVRF